MFLNRTIKLQSHLSDNNNTRRKARRLHWAAIKPGLYRNIVLHDNDKLTRTDSDHLIKGNNQL